MVGRKKEERGTCHGNNRHEVTRLSSRVFRAQPSLRGSMGSTTRRCRAPTARTSCIAALSVATQPLLPTTVSCPFCGTSAAEVCGHGLLTNVCFPQRQPHTTGGRCGGRREARIFLEHAAETLGTDFVLAAKLHGIIEVGGGARVGHLFAPL